MARSVIAVTAGLLGLIILTYIATMVATIVILSGNVNPAPTPVFLVISALYIVLFGVAGGFITASVSTETPHRDIAILSAIVFVLWIISSIIQFERQSIYYSLLLLVTLPMAVLAGDRVGVAARNDMENPMLACDLGHRLGQRRIHVAEHARPEGLPFRIPREEGRPRLLSRRLESRLRRPAGPVQRTLEGIRRPERLRPGDLGGRNLVPSRPVRGSEIILPLGEPMDSNIDSMSATLACLMSNCVSSNFVSSCSTAFAIRSRLSSVSQTKI